MDLFHTHRMDAIGDAENDRRVRFKVLRVGVTVMRYVTHESCRPWLIFSYKNLKGRSITPEEDEDIDQPEPSTSGPRHEKGESSASDADPSKCTPSRRDARSSTDTQSSADVRLSTDMRSSVEEDVTHAAVQSDMEKHPTSDGREALTVETGEESSDLPLPPPSSPNHTIRLLLKNKSCIYIECEQSDGETRDAPHADGEEEATCEEIEPSLINTESDAGTTEQPAKEGREKEESTKYQQKTVELPIFQSPPSVGRVVDLQVIGNQVVIKSTSTVPVESGSERSPRFLLVESSDGLTEVVSSENMALSADGDQSAEESVVTDVSAPASPSHLSSHVPSPFTSPFTSPPVSQPPSRVASPVPSQTPSQATSPQPSLSSSVAEEVPAPQPPPDVSDQSVPAATSALDMVPPSGDSFSSSTPADVPTISETFTRLSHASLAPRDSASSSTVLLDAPPSVQQDVVPVSLQPSGGIAESSGTSELSSMAYPPADVEIGKFHVLAASSTTDVVEDAAETQNSCVSADVLWPSSAPVSVTSSPVPKPVLNFRETRSATASPLQYSPATSPSPHCVKPPISGTTVTASGVRIHLPRVREQPDCPSGQQAELTTVSLPREKHQTLPSHDGISEVSQDSIPFPSEMNPAAVGLPISDQKVDDAEEADSMLYPLVPPDLVSVTVPRDTDESMEAEDSMFAVHQYIAQSVIPRSSVPRVSTPATSPVLAATPQSSTPHSASLAWSTAVATAAAAEAHDVVSEVIHSTQFPSSDDESEMGDIPLGSYKPFPTHGVSSLAATGEHIEYSPSTASQPQPLQTGLLKTQASVVRLPAPAVQHAPDSPVVSSKQVLPSASQDSSMPVFLVRASPVKASVQHNVDSGVGPTTQHSLLSPADTVLTQTTSHEGISSIGLPEGDDSRSEFRDLAASSTTDVVEEAAESRNSQISGYVDQTASWTAQSSEILSPAAVVSQSPPAGFSSPLPTQLTSPGAKRKLSVSISHAIASLSPAAKDTLGTPPSKVQEPSSQASLSLATPSRASGAMPSVGAASKPPYSVQLSSMLGAISQPGTARLVLGAAATPPVPEPSTSETDTSSEPAAKVAKQAPPVLHRTESKARSGLASGVTHLLVVPRGSEQRAQQLLAQSHPQMKPEALAAQLQGLMTDPAQSTRQSLTSTTSTTAKYSLLSQQTPKSTAPMGTSTSLTPASADKMSDSCATSEADKALTTGVISPMSALRTRLKTAQTPTLISVTPTSSTPVRTLAHGTGTSQVSLLKQAASRPATSAVHLKLNSGILSTLSAAVSVDSQPTTKASPTTLITSKTSSVTVPTGTETATTLSMESTQAIAAVVKKPPARKPTVSTPQKSKVTESTVTAVTSGTSRKPIAAVPNVKASDASQSILIEKTSSSRSLLKTNIKMAVTSGSPTAGSSGVLSKESAVGTSKGPHFKPTTLTASGKPEKVSHPAKKETEPIEKTELKKSSGKALMKSSRTWQAGRSGGPTFQSSTPSIGSVMEQLQSASGKHEETSPLKVPPAVRAKPSIPRTRPRNPKLPFKLSGSSALQALPLDIQQKVANALTGALGSRHTGPIKIKLPAGYSVPAGDQSIKVSVITPEQARQMGLPVPAAASKESTKVKATSVAKPSTSAENPSTGPSSSKERKGPKPQLMVRKASPHLKGADRPKVAVATDQPISKASGGKTNVAGVEDVTDTETLPQVDGTGDEKPESPAEQSDRTAAGSMSASHVPNISMVLPQIPDITPSVWELTENMTTIQPLYGSQDSSVLSYPTATVLVDDRGEVIAQSQTDFRPFSLDPEPIELLPSTSAGISQVPPGQMLIDIVPVSGRQTKGAKKGAGLRREGVGMKKSQRQTAGVPPAKFSKWEQPEAAPAGGPYQRVRLVIRPWRTPDGTVNRPTLCTMLETMLAYVMTKPGMSSSDIFKKYTPIMQPVPVMELLEMLEEIGCIERQILSRSHKTSLFSPRVQINPVSVDHGNEIVTFFPKIDCVLKLGHFEAQLLEKRSKLPFQEHGVSGGV